MQRHMRWFEGGRSQLAACHWPAPAPALSLSMFGAGAAGCQVRAVCSGRMTTIPDDPACACSVCVWCDLCVVLASAAEAVAGATKEN